MLGFYRIYIVPAIFILLFSVEMHGQILREEWVDYEIKENLDTLYLKRENGEWWFGGFAGVRAIQWFGDFYMSNIRYEGIIPAETLRTAKINHRLSYPSGWGYNEFGGVHAEWARPGNDISWGFRFYLFDYLYSSDQTVQDNYPLPGDYTPILRYSYLTIAPEATYYLEIPNLHLFGGLDFSFIFSGRTTVKWDYTKTNEPGRHVTNELNVDEQQNNWRIGAHVGVGYHLFLIDFAKMWRIRVTPFLSFHGGSEVYSGYGSSLNNIFGQLGVSVKFGKDKVTEKAAVMDKYFKPKPKVIAQVGEFNKPALPRVLAYNSIAYQLAYFTPPMIEGGLTAKSDLQPGTSGKIELLPRVKKQYKINYGEAQPFAIYQNVNSTVPNQELKDYLDEAATFMLKNPGSMIRVVGYSDNRGTLTQNQTRSIARADQVVQYLLKKNIPRRRILAEGRGSADPVADNLTEEGARRNRRVEIIVYQK